MTKPPVCWCSKICITPTTISSFLLLSSVIFCRFYIELLRYLFFLVLRVPFNNNFARLSSSIKCMSYFFIFKSLFATKVSIQYSKSGLAYVTHLNKLLHLCYKTLWYVATTEFYLPLRGSANLQRQHFDCSFLFALSHHLCPHRHCRFAECWSISLSLKQRRWLTKRVQQRQHEELQRCESPERHIVWWGRSHVVHSSSTRFVAVQYDAAHWGVTVTAFL